MFKKLIETKSQIFFNLDHFDQCTKPTLMKIKLLLLTCIFILTTACQNQKKETSTNVDIKVTVYQSDLPDSLSTRRINFVLDLKRTVAERVWSDFGKKQNEGTLIYFDTDRSEIFFPDTQVKEKLQDYIKHSDSYWLSDRLDSILPYHMEVMISFNEEDSTQYFFRNPVEQYSSVEEIGSYISSVESTEMWATMVVHEMFHHYQYNNPNYNKYAEAVIGVLPFDSRNLEALCREDKQFITLIRAENDILMKALAEDNKTARDTLISAYLSERKKRIDMYSVENPYLEQVENYYIIQEGSARYIEYHSMFILSSYFNNADAPTVLKDPEFNAYSEFEIIDLDSDAFNYLVYAGPTDYHYTLGFNTMRLLDKLKIDYKPNLLDHPEKGLHEYLEDYMTSLTNNS